MRISGTAWTSTACSRSRTPWATSFKRAKGSPRRTRQASSTAISSRATFSSRRNRTGQPCSSPRLRDLEGPPGRGRGGHHDDRRAHGLPDVHGARADAVHEELYARAVFWSLGLILYELLRGEGPVRGGIDPRGVRRRHERAFAPLAKSFAPTSRAELEAVLPSAWRRIGVSLRERGGARSLARALRRAALARAFGAGEHRGETLRSEAPARGKMAPTLPEEPSPVQASSGDPGRDPDSVPSVVSGAATTASSEDDRIALGAAACVGTVTGIAFVARGVWNKTASASSAAPPASLAPQPVATADVPSIPFDALPVAAHDAAPPRAVAPAPHDTPTSIAPPAVVSTSAPAAPPTPRARASKPASKKDGWKWGDRN